MEFLQKQGGKADVKRGKGQDTSAIEKNKKNVRFAASGVVRSFHDFG